MVLIAIVNKYNMFSVDKIKDYIKIIIVKIISQRVLIEILTFLGSIKLKRQVTKEIKQWKKSGRPVPPPHLIKQLTVKKYQKRYGIKILIESGTYMGAMVEAQKKIFNKIISIELSSELYNLAIEKFKNDKNVTIIQGDSGVVLPVILEKIDSPAIFWLDGHYSYGITARGNKECPILEELDAILNCKILNHIILIDDARCFNGKGDYPAIDQLIDFIKNKNRNYKVEVKYDIIRCLPV